MKIQCDLGIKKKYLITNNLIHLTKKRKRE